MAIPGTARRAITVGSFVSKTTFESEDGAHDGVVPPAMWPDARGVRDLTIVTMQRSAHTPFVEEPDEFVDAVSHWLDDLVPHPRG